MRKEWISYLNFFCKRTEQKLEKNNSKIKIKFMMKNTTHINYHNFYDKLYSRQSHLHIKPITNYLW